MNTLRNEKNYLMQTVQKAVQVLRAFSVENNRLTLTEINELTNIGISSLQRILYTLVAEGLLRRDEIDKRYELGIDFIFLAELVKKNSSLMAVAEPILKRINAVTTETVGLNIVEDNQRKCILSIDSKHELTALTYVGHLSPLYAGASAKLFLAYFTEEELDAYLANVTFEKIQAYTITSKEQLLADINEIKRNGYAVSREERVKGTMALSAPIFDPFSNCIAALTISLPLVRENDYEFDFLINELKQGAKEITKQLRN